MPEERSDRIVVRKVTEVHANWSEHQTDTPGKFSFQLILDDGAEEQVIRPSPEAAKVLLKLLTSGKDVYFDTERRVVAVRDGE